MNSDERPLVGIVGPCGSGKSAVRQVLCSLQIDAREIAQEHSGVPAMWQRFTNPDLLVYLDVSREEAGRRKGWELPEPYWNRLLGRLAHARTHADLVVMTDTLGVDEVAKEVVGFLQTLGAYSPVSIGSPDKSHDL